MRSPRPSDRALGTSNTDLHKKKKRRTAIIVTAAIVAALVIVVAGVTIANWDDYRQLARDREVVAECNGYDIPYEELRFVTMFYKRELEYQYGEGIWEDPTTAEAHREELETLVSDYLCQNYIVLTACEELGIDTDSKTADKYVDEQMKKINSDFESRKDLREFLEENCMSERYLRFQLRITFLQASVDITLRDNDLYAYRLEDNAAEFKDYVEKSGEYICTRHVFIENDEGEKPEKNRDRAAYLSRTLLAITDLDDRNAKMIEMMGSVDNESLELPAYGYYFMLDEIDDAYRNAVLALDIGGVSDAVECENGYYVIMRLKPSRDYIDDNVATLLEHYQAVSFNNYMESFRDKCTVTFNEEGKAIDLVAMQ